MKKTRLIIDPKFDFKLMGLISSAKGHKLAWEINQAIRVNLIKDTDLVLRFLNNEKLILLNFKYETENGKLLLIKNRSIESNSFSPNYIIPELQRFDYLIWIKETDDLKVEEIMNKLKEVKAIQYIVKIDPNGLKSKDNLLF